MKYAIYPDKTGTISVPSENAAYPVTNLSDDYRKNPWKAVGYVNSTTLTIPISAITSALGAIAWFGSNATSFSLTITDTITFATVLSASGSISYGRCWFDFTPTANALSASLTLTTTEDTIECGVLRAGDVVEVGNPSDGATETFKDYSIKKPLRNGAYYLKKLEIVRTLSYSMQILRETKFRNLMELYEAYGPYPFAMLIADSAGDDHRWSVFGSFDGQPSGNHDSPNYSSVSVSIEETV